MKRILFILCSFLLPVYMMGQVYYSPSLEQRAFDGDLDAIYDMGSCYYNGNGLHRNFEQAVNWYAKAARKGHVGAMKTLSSLYKYGHGVAKSAEKSATFLEAKKAAEAGEQERAKALVEKALAR